MLLLTFLLYPFKLKNCFFRARVRALARARKIGHGHGHVANSTFMMCIFLMGTFIGGFLQASAEQLTDGALSASRRIQAHLTLKDFAAAKEEAHQALAAFPQSLFLHEGLIRVSSRLGEEKEMLQAWNIYAGLFPEKALNRELIEEMAWGVLNKASHSSSLLMREMALLAAFFSQDSKGIAILYQGMRDPNYAVRQVAVKLASHFRDQKLIGQVKYLFKHEKTWPVRQRVLEAIGTMKIDSLRLDLEGLVASENSLPKEKALAITALVELLDQVNRPEIERLAQSNRSGLRQLACQAIAHFQSLRDLDCLLQLAQDAQADVRLEAFQAIGQLRPVSQVEAVLSVARRGIKDAHPQVALSAAWLLILYAPEEGKQAFIPFLADDRRDVRLLAAAALSTAGSYGMSLVLDQFRTHSDPYVRLNLALGLIGQRLAVQDAAVFLNHMLMTEKDKWSTLESGLFSAISNKPQKKGNESLTTSEMENHLLRLDLLNLLAILKGSEAQEAIRNYLMDRSWGISATAAALLLTEGDESAIVLVQQLLQDPQPRIRLQAALVLSLWSREESAIQVLEEGYAANDRELKERILESLGRIGSIHSVPFLINALKEPSQTMRLIAAMSLIQCLNH